MTCGIWQERNNQIFKKQKRSEAQVADFIKSTVRLKLLTCRFKKTANVIDLIRVWKLSPSLMHTWWRAFPKIFGVGWLIWSLWKLLGAWWILRAVLFFPYSKVFPLSFYLDRFLRRQSHLTHQSPSKRRMDTCYFHWWFPIGVLVTVCC